jgi:hypothetical protein
MGGVRSARLGSSRPLSRSLRIAPEVAAHRRPDPLTGVWDSQIVHVGGGSVLAIFEAICRPHPEIGPGVRRTRRCFKRGKQALASVH